MKKMQVLRALLVEGIARIDSGECSINEELMDGLISYAAKFINPNKMNKYQSCRYVGLSRSRFDDYVRLGVIPKGTPDAGTSTLYWHKSDLDDFLALKLTNKK